ncbi:MAG: hypothetical protein ABJL44_03185 [Algibacter sp.]
MIKNKQQINWIDSVGIGLFMMSAIMRFSYLLEIIFGDFLIAIGLGPKMVLWLPKIISLLFVVIISILVINKMNTMDDVISRKNLKKVIGIFFGFLIIQVLYSTFRFDIMSYLYPKEFDAFYDKDTIGNKDIYVALINFIPLLKYLAFGSILLLKRDEAAGKGIKGSNQISEIGES